MVSSIRKRDARIVPFDVNKIAQAIFRAASSQGGKDYVLSLKIAAEVLERLNEQFEDAVPDVEQVQDLVEKTLIKSGHARTAKAYILYRHQRTKIREMNTRLMTTIRDLTFKDAKDNDLKRENANIDGDTAMGMMLRYGSESSKQFYEMYILNPKHSLAHKNGDIHIHDLDFLSLTTTCCQIDIKTLFKGGFGTGHGFLREPNDIRSYSALACIAIQANQNDQHGGQSIPNFEYGLAPGVAKTFIKELCLILDLYNMESKDAVKAGLRAYIEENESILDEKGLAFVREILTQHAPALNIDFAVKKALEYTEKATYQAMEALVHNLNTMHSRAGAQIPFSSINYGTDTSPEGRMVIRNVLLATEAGLGNGETPIFPVQIFRVKEGVNYHPYLPRDDGRLPMSDFGGEHRYNVTGLYHDIWGFPTGNPDEVRKLVYHLVDKIEAKADEIARYKALYLDDARQIFISYGSSARSTLHLVNTLRERGIRAGLIELQTLWPFPAALIARLTEKARTLYVVEMNMGQICAQVKQAAREPDRVFLINRMDGQLITPTDIGNVMRVVEGRGF